jgi:hypothetical protein
LVFGLLVNCNNKSRYKITEDYFLWTTGDLAQMTLCYLDYGKYNIGIIGPCVFAAGSDQRHIIVKEHPLRDGQIDKSKTLYYIIPLQNKVSNDPQKNYRGPYQKDKFERVRDTLGVSKYLDFTLVLKQLD